MLAQCHQLVVNHLNVMRDCMWVLPSIGWQPVIRPTDLEQMWWCYLCNSHQRTIEVIENSGITNSKLIVTNDTD